MATQIDIVSKKIAVKDIRRLIIKGDSIDTVQFKMLKNYDGIDLSAATFILKYELPSGNIGSDACTQSTDGQWLLVNWTPSSGSTSESGSLKIQLQATTAASKVWQTEESSINVQTGISSGDYSFTDTLLDQYLALFQAEVTSAEAAQASASASEIAAGLSAGEAADSETAAGLSEAAPPRVLQQHRGMRQTPLRPR